MATPFTVFRKYSGIMMAFFGALLMLSFVVADPLMNWMSGRSGGGPASGGKEVAVSWNGGQLTEQQLATLVMHRRILTQFQGAVHDIGLRSAYEAGVSESELMTPRVQPLILPSTSEQGVERDVVVRKLVAEAATKSGMVVTNEMISEYLLNLGRSRVSKDQMRGLMSQINAGGGTKASIEFVFELLREAMLARNYEMSYAYAVSTVLPQERWADWKRFNDQITLEAVALPVADFVSQVAEPTDAEIKELYEEFKEREPAPEMLYAFGGVELPSPKPAFSVPRKVVLQYVKADFQKMADDLEASVTAEEIQKYYDENKDLFIRADADLSADDAASEEDAATEEEKTEDSTSEPAEETPADEESAADAAPATDTPAEKPAAAAPAAAVPAATEGSSSAIASPFRLVALQEPAADAPAAEVAIDAPPAAEKEADSTADQSATEEPAAEEPASDAAATEEPADSSAADTDAKAEAPPKYQPLEEVTDQIRRSLAEQKAAEAIRKLIDDAYGEVNSSYSDYLTAQLDAQDAGEKAPEPPAALTDLKPLAEKYKLTAEKTTALSGFELRDVPLGQVRCPAYTLPGTTPDGERAAVPQNLTYVLFGGSKVEKHQPLIAFDKDNGDRYVAMLVEDSPRSTPKLEEIRDQVVAAWKRRKAADLALKAAEEQAAKVRETGRTLKDFFASDDTKQVGVTDPFSFFNVTGVSPTTGEFTLQLSNPEPLQAAGPDLLKKAFELKDGELGTSLNYSRDTAYLFRVNERLQSEETLKEDFVKNSDRWFNMQLRPMIAGRQMNARNRVFGDLVRNAEIDWKRPADVVTPGA